MSKSVQFHRLVWRSGKW